MTIHGLLRGAALLVVLVPCTYAASFSQLVIFGDSLSDTGNAAIATGGVAPGPNYWNGRFTDGPTTSPATNGPIGLWADQLAGKLGVADPQPFLAGGTNYAIASAMTGANAIQDISNQIGYFSVGVNGSAPASALYAVWGGANDLYFGGNTPTVAADLLSGNIQTLAAEGAKTILWMNLPALGDTPLGAASGQATALNGASMLFDSEWAIDVAKLQAQGINVVGVDVYSLFLQVKTHPGAFGFSDVNDPAQGVSGIDPNTYLFWDQEHPTTAGHALVADLAYNDLPGTATPEPASFLFMAVGMAGLLVVGRVRGVRSGAFRRREQ